MRRVGFLMAAALVSGIFAGGQTLAAPAGPAAKHGAAEQPAAGVILAGSRDERRGEVRRADGSRVEWRERDGRRRGEWRDGDGRRRGEWRDGDGNRGEWRERDRDRRVERHEDRHERRAERRDDRRDWGRDWGRDWDRDRHRHRDWGRGWDRDRHRHGWDRGRHYGWGDGGHPRYNGGYRRWRAHHHPRHRHWVGRRMPRVEYVVIRDYDTYYLPPPRRGHFYARVDNDVYLVAEATKNIIDAFVLLDAVGRY